MTTLKKNPLLLVGSFDEEAYRLWQETGVSTERIAKLPRANNWWDPAGTTGPCGPDTEIFYWTGDANQVPASFNDDHKNWVEIWNNVFMEYNKDASGRYEPLLQKNIDTGLGLERMVAVINGIDDNYRTDLFSNLIAKLEELSGRSYNQDEETKKAMRVVADHIKAATFIIGDDKGITPANTDQGYVVRRLIRRALRYAKTLEIKETDLSAKLADIVIKDYQDVYGELGRNAAFIRQSLAQEEEKFIQTLERGLKEFTKLSAHDLSGQEAFGLYQSYGFPLEMTEEMAKEKGIKVDRAVFELEFKKHQDLSRTAAAGKFKGGLADAGTETTRLHTATHLLLAALRRVLGDNIYQRGSNITPERLRLDFNYAEKMTPEQIAAVENLVNGAIKADYPVSFEEMSVDEAKARGAMGVFDSKYGEMVKVYTVGPQDETEKPILAEVFSQEICGGPHVTRTGEMGQFSILKEEASSAGVRRIKAVLK